MTRVIRRAIGLLLATLGLLTAGGVLAQSKADALADFDFVLQVIRRDYSGYADKTGGGKGAAFEALVRAKRAQLERNPANEAAIVNDVLSWFRDRHVGFSAAPSDRSDPSTGSDDARLAARGPFLAVDRGAPGAGKQPLVGSTWASADGNYQAVLVGDATAQGRVLGVITDSKSPAWSRGQIKFALAPSGREWAGTYYMRDHSREVAPAVFLGQGSVLRFGKLAVDWVRVNPAPTVPLDHLVPSTEFSLRRLSDRTAFLRLPDFRAENRVRIEKLLEDNRALLESTPNLVIDLRGNGGGSDGSYEKLMSWLYTRPIYSIGVEFRASPRNADLYEKMSEEPSFPPETVSLLRRIVTRMRAGKDGWISPDDKPFVITTYPRVMPNPQRVGILITGAGSSGDQFVLDARQSRKVTTFGGPTAGVIDYSNVLEEVSPSKRFVLRWATSRSMRLPEEPIDNVGIQPDVPIGDEVDDPVRQVQAWLERQVD